MKIIFSIFLTLALVSCGEIRLQTGGDDLGEVGEWVWQPIDAQTAYLVNSRLGSVRRCAVQPENSLYFDCLIAASPNMTVEQMSALNILTIETRQIGN